MKRNIVTPSILSGFLEFLPEDQIQFDKMKESIQKSFEQFGFIPVDTPHIEKAEILLAKGGGDTEKEIYRFKKGKRELALRFDLTVPLARFVAQHYSDLTFPFRRFHIGKVFRGERPQRGRFREFYQCDIDIIGNGKLSLINDAEIPSIIYTTFKNLGFEDFVIRINNRKVLNGFYASLDIDNKSDVLRIIDKLEKIGKENVTTELQQIDIDNQKIAELLEFTDIKGTPSEILKNLDDLKIENEMFNEGVNELREVVNYINAFKVPSKNYKIDLSIARGLDYYTGTIYETILTDYPQIGSVCSGGRYDDLAGYYTKQNLPGVGISIGLTRLFYQLREAGFFKEKGKSSLSQILVIPMENCYIEAIKIASELRASGIITEVYSNKGKIAKKFTYANNLGIPYVVVVGEDEIKANKYTLKNMKSGEQQNLDIQSIVDFVKL